MRRQSPWVWLLSLLAFVLGCGSPELPPGGKAAVEYWHRVLKQCPDLPAKVEAIVQQHGSLHYHEHDLPQTEVRIYTEQGPVSYSGSKIELIVTNLDLPELEKLLEVWKHIPDQAAELGLSESNYESNSGRRQVVVLGSDGRVEIRGAVDREMQSIKILSDEAAARTTIGIHTFGPSGQAAFDELVRNYHAVRGPPSAEVSSGHISLPPPGDTLTILVVGKMRDLNIGGPSGYATQDISLAAYLHGHQAFDTVAGVSAGLPFAEQIARNTQPTSTNSEGTTSAYSSSSSIPLAAPEASSGSYSGGGGYSPSPAQVPQGTTFNPPVYNPISPPITPPIYNPPPIQPPIYIPPPMFNPPKPVTPPVRFR